MLVILCDQKKSIKWKDNDVEAMVGWIALNLFQHSISCALLIMNGLTDNNMLSEWSLLRFLFHVKTLGFTAFRTEIRSDCDLKLFNSWFS